jgi:aldose 1-epimerase
VSGAPTAASPTGEQLEIVSGTQRAVVVEVGAGLRTYAVDGHDVIDGYDADEPCPAGKGQHLMPWPNRVEDGSYTFDGRQHRLPLTEPERRNAIHGLVRWSAWTVVERASDRAALEHVLRPQSGYPFSLALRVEYALSDEGLSVETTARNIGTERCPFGSGAHPYLTAGSRVVDESELQVPARTVLRTDERGLPVGASPVAGSDYDFRASRPLGPTRLDDCFTDLDRDEAGVARVELGDPAGATTVALWVDPSYPYLMLFTGDPLPEVARRSLAVEPMTCPPNAFRSGESLVVLDPGATWRGAWGISRR